VPVTLLSTIPIFCKYFRVRERVRAFRSSGFPFLYRTLEAFEALYTKVGPQNYGWYQCRLHLAAKKVYDAEAIPAVQGLWKTFAITDPQLVGSLKKIHPEMAKVLTGWSR
jgi:hypothetical protein